MLIFFLYRYKCFLGLKNEIEKNEGGLEKFSRGYERFGINRTHEGLVYREWAPAARGVYLIGDFSKWHEQLLLYLIGDFSKWHEPP